MSVVESVERDIAKLGAEAAGMGLAATALALARELDDLMAEEACEECGHVQEFTVGRNSATSKSLCATALIKVMQELRALAPPKIQEDRVDEIAKRRERRISSTAG
jgi:hypothetical protein